MQEIQQEVQRLMKSYLEDLDRWKILFSRMRETQP